MLIGRSMVRGWWKHGVFWNPGVLIKLNRTASGHKMRILPGACSPSVVYRGRRCLVTK